MDLKGKVALVTGGASGIGRAYCEELLKQGCKVSICDIDPKTGEDLAANLGAKYGKDKVLFCLCDVTDYPRFEESFQTTASVLGGIDIVINNAGIMNDRFWELEVDINLNGVIRGLLLAFRFMGKDKGGRGGVVVNTGSDLALRYYVSVPIYTATKHALIGLTRAYGDSYHVNLTGIKVLTLCPGPTESNLITDIKKHLLSSEYEKMWDKETANRIPQKAGHVAKSMIQMLQKAESGSVWLVENNQPAKEIPPSPH